MEKVKRKRIISVIGCLSVQLCVGILYLWSIFKTPVMQHYHFSESATDMVSSGMIMGFVLGNLIGGAVQDRTNPRLVATVGAALFSLGIFLTSFLTVRSIGLIFLTYCTLGGLGCGAAYGSILSCLQKWFPNKRGLASGLSVASFGLSTVVFGPVSQTLLKLDAFGTKAVPYTFLTLSLVFFSVSMIACLFIRVPGKDDIKALCVASAEGRPADAPQTAAHPQTSSEPQDLTPLQALKNPAFWCIAVCCFFINGTWNILLPHIKPLGENLRGLSENAAVLAVTITGVTNTLGRFSMASLSDKIGRVRTMVLLASITLVGAIALIWAMGPFYILVVAVIAFSYGGPSATLPVMTTDLCGTKYSGTNYGIVMLGLGFSSLVFNALSRLLIQTTNGYTASFIMGACTCVISIALLLLYRALVNKQRRRIAIKPQPDTAQHGSDAC